jgi:hypothetical protein
MTQTFYAHMNKIKILKILSEILKLTGDELRPCTYNHGNIAKVFKNHVTNVF